MKWLGEILAAYYHIFERYSDDPEFSVKALFALTVVQLAMTALIIADIVLRVNLINRLSSTWFTAAAFIIFIPLLFFIELPEPKENNKIVYASLLIVAFPFLYAFAAWMLG